MLLPIIKFHLIFFPVSLGTPFFYWPISLARYQPILLFFFDRCLHQRDRGPFWQHVRARRSRGRIYSLWALGNAIMSAAFLTGTSSTTDLLPPLRRSGFGLFPRDRPDVRKVLIPVAALFIFVTIAVATGVSTKGRTSKKADSDKEHPVMARLAAAKLDFDLLNSSALESHGSSAHGPHGRRFGDRDGNKTLQLGDNYEELDKI